MRKIILMLALVFTCSTAGAEDSMTFKGVPWGISQQQLRAKSVFKDVTCIEDKSENRLVACQGDTTYVGREASARISFLDDKLSSIELLLDASEGSLYQYKEFREVLTDKYGLPKKCDEPAKPVKSNVLNFNHESLKCSWISSDGLTIINLIQYRLISKDTARPKWKYDRGLGVTYGLIDEKKTMFKLGQEAIAKEEFKRKNDL